MTIQTTLRKVPDGEALRISKYGRTYEMVQKKKGKAIITSISSSRTYEKPLKTKCFIEE